MSLHIPIGVRLASAHMDRHVTADLRDLTYRAAIPGGFTSAQLSLHRPLALPADELAQYTTAVVYGNDGETLWEGRLEDPGRSAGADGQVYDVNVIGPAGHAQDRTVPLIYADRDLSGLVRVENITPGARDSIGEIPNGTGDQGLVLQFSAGLPLVAGSLVAVQYRHLWHAGQKIARYDYTWDAGVTSTSQQVQAVTRTNTTGSLGAGEASRAENFNTAGGGSAPRVVGTDWTNGRNSVELRIIRLNTPGTVVADDNWAGIKDFIVVAMRHNADGTEKTSSYTTNYVLASEVVADLLGRLLTQYDGAGATIAATSYQIDQLSYPNGVTAERVLADLMALESGHYWAAWESNATGLHRFEWVPWPNTIRFEVDIDDGFDSPASADGLYNAASVRYREANGEIITVRVTSSVPALDAAGLTREAYIDLAGEVGSAANATQVATRFLLDHAAAPNRGTLTVGGPIYDRSMGRMLMPWELPRRAPGGLIRVRGVAPTVDSLNATGRDGTSVFRVVGAEFTASTATSTLTLDSFPPSVPHMLARLARTTPRRR